MAVASVMTTAQRIDAAWAAKNDPPRSHLGASQIGEECLRKLWYSFRWARKITHNGRIMRLFDRGKREEAPLVQALRDAGIRVETTRGKGKDPIQFTKLAGHFGGTLDAIGKGFPEHPDDWHVVEFKTHNNKSYLALEELGVFTAKPLHWAQMQAYMGFSGLKRACYIAVNKDTDEIFVEFVKFDPEAYRDILEKAHMVVETPEPPSRYGGSYGCKWCDYAAICKGGKALANCRTCKHSSPVMEPADQSEPTWWCNLHGFTIERCSIDVTEHKCPQYEPIQETVITAIKE